MRRAAEPGDFRFADHCKGCPCGCATHPAKECTCTPLQIQRYLARISGPLLDRIDIHIDVPPLKYREITTDDTGEPSAAIRDRVRRARAVQQERFRRARGVYCNAHMASRHIKRHCAIQGEAADLLETAMERLSLSARAYDRILKVARTIADLAGQEAIAPEHVAEAIQYRPLDRAPRR